MAAGIQNSSYNKELFFSENYPHKFLIDPPYQKTAAWEHFDYVFWTRWLVNHRTVGIYITLAYLIIIFGLKQWMKSRQPFELRKPLIFWNAGMALFSGLAIYQTYTSFVHVLTSENGGIYSSVCIKEGMSMTMAFWGFLAFWSRVVEMGDTIFIVLRKRPLIFLHWYHHAIVVAFMFFTASSWDPAARWYFFVNLSVHAVMYTYYALRAAGVKTPKQFAMAITTMQLVQFVGIFILSSYSIYGIAQGWECHRNPGYAIGDMCIGASLFFLFAKFFIERYFNNGRKKADHVTKKQKTK